MNAVFDACVTLLQFLARMTGTTYKEINVIIFCVVWPLVTMALICAVIVQKQQIDTYRELLDKKLDEELRRKAASFIKENKKDG